MLIDTKMKEWRQGVCRSCEQYIPLTDMCKKCGCIITLKSRFKKALCPLHKWGEEGPPPKNM